MKTKINEIKRIQKQINYNQKYLDEIKSKDKKTNFDKDTVSLLEDGINNQLDRIKLLYQSMLN